MEQTQKQPHTQGAGGEGASGGLAAPQSTPNLLDFPHCPQHAECMLLSHKTSHTRTHETSPGLLSWKS